MLLLLMHRQLKLNWTRQGSSCNTNIPSRIKEEVGKYTHTYGTQAAIKRFKSRYPHYTFLRTTINNWKRKFNKKEGVPSESPTFRKAGRPNYCQR